MENERRRSVDRERRAAEIQQASLERKAQIHSTLSNADNILSERKNATMEVIERKRKQMSDRQLKAEEDSKNARLVSIQKTHAHADKISKAKKDLQEKIETMQTQQMAKESGHRQNIDQNKSNFNAVLAKKRQKEIEIKERVELASNAQIAKQNTYLDKLIEKK